MAVDRYNERDEVKVKAVAVAVASATIASGSATANKAGGSITAALTTAADGTDDLVINNELIAAGDIVFAAARLGTATNGKPVVIGAVTAAGKVTLTVANLDASNALNGTVIVDYVVFKNR